jgi:hypothetical protein
MTYWHEHLQGLGVSLEGVGNMYDIVLDAFMLLVRNCRRSFYLFLLIHKCMIVKI